MNNLMKYILAHIVPVYGELYTNNNATAVTIPAGTTFTQYIIPNTQVAEVRNVTIGSGVDQVTIEKTAIYKITCTFSSKSDTSNIRLDTILRENGNEIPNMHIAREFSGVNLLSTATLTGLVKLHKGDVVTLAIKHSGGSAINITTVYANMNIHRVY